MAKSPIKYDVFNSSYSDSIRRCLSHSYEAANRMAFNHFSEYDTKEEYNSNALRSYLACDYLEKELMKYVRFLRSVKQESKRLSGDFDGSILSGVFFV